MKKFLINLICLFIFSKKKRKKFKQKHLSTNLTNIAPDNHIEIAKGDETHITLSVQGKNNTIIIKKLHKDTKGKLNISLAGNNCHITIEENILISGVLTIIVGQNHPNFSLIENTNISIGKDTSFEICTISTYNSNATIEIGEKCMFSYGIDLFHTDAHPIYNLDKSKIINKVKTMKIGNHVWVGARAVILKNSIIPDDSIVGFSSVVSSKSFKGESGHCIAAGNPATIIKREISWDADGSKGYIQNIPD